MREHYDIVVVGAGPAALVFLKFLSSRFNVAVFEKLREVGVIEHCTGIVSHRVIDIVGKPALKSILNKFSSLRILTENNIELRIIPSKPVYVLDRVRYVKELFDTVKDKYDFYFATKVENIKVKDNVVKAELSSKANVCSNIIVNAEGAIQRIRKSILGKTVIRPPKVYGVQADCKGKVDNIDEFIVFFSDRFAKEFFGWIVPLNSNKVRIGIGGKNANLSLLNTFIKFVSSRNIVLVKEKIKVFGGLIFRTPPFWKDHYQGVLMLGDAGFHVKPITGGGLYVHSMFAKKLAETLSFKRNELINALNTYEKLTRGLRLKLKIQGAISKTFHELPLKEKENIFRAIGGLGELKEVDYDHHEKLLGTMISKPKLICRLFSKAQFITKNLVYSLKLFFQ